MNAGRYRKGIAAAIVAIGVILCTVLQGGDLGALDWTAMVVSVLGAFGVVQATNDPPK